MGDKCVKSVYFAEEKFEKNADDTDNTDLQIRALCSNKKLKEYQYEKCIIFCFNCFGNPKLHNI